MAHAPEWSRSAYRTVQRRAFVPNRRIDEQARVESLRAAHPDLSLDDFAVVTCFFNPCGYRSRVENFSVFHRELQSAGVPSLVVELAFGDRPHELEVDGGEILRVRADDAMWQKERLLNLGIRELLDRGYRKIAWLDADIVFEAAESWPWAVAAELESSRLCQVFGQVLVDQGPEQAMLPGVAAVRYWRETGLPWVLSRLGPRWNRPAGYPLGYSGYGWAARAEVLEQATLYDAAVVGGGDKLIYAASLPMEGDWRDRVGKLFESTLPACAECGHVNESPPMIEHFLEWARRWSEAVGGSVGSTGETIRSLYHGDRSDRRYMKRRDILLRHRFSPFEDVELDESGCWRWSSDKPDLHLQVESYFYERREDE